MMLLCIMTEQEFVVYGKFNFDVCVYEKSLQHILLFLVINQITTSKRTYYLAAASSAVAKQWVQGNVLYQFCFTFALVMYSTHYVFVSGD